MLNSRHVFIRRGTVVDPRVVDDAAEAVEAGVGAGGAAVEIELDLRRGIVHLDDRGETKVFVFHECGHGSFSKRYLH